MFTDIRTVSVVPFSFNFLKACHVHRLQPAPAWDLTHLITLYVCQWGACQRLSFLVVVVDAERTRRRVRARCGDINGHTKQSVLRN